MKRHPEQTSHKTACNTTQDRKIENKKMSKTRRILTLQNQKENRATGTSKRSSIEWHPKIEEELIILKLVKSRNQENQ